MEASAVSPPAFICDADGTLQRMMQVESDRLLDQVLTLVNHDLFFIELLFFKLKLGALLIAQPGCMLHSLAGQPLRLCPSSDA